MTENVKPARVAMPTVAAWVDELRAALGRELVDQAMAAGQQLRRQYDQMVLAVGRDAADRWLRRQPTPRGSFWATEGGHQVGQRRT